MATERRTSFSNQLYQERIQNNDEPHTVWMVERERGEMGGIPNFKEASPSAPHKMSDKDDNRFMWVKEIERNIAICGHDRMA